MANSNPSNNEEPEPEEKKQEKLIMADQYKASHSTGIYGSYAIKSNIKNYKYCASISNGSFGTWLYNDASPIIQIKQQQQKKKKTDKNKVEIFSSRKSYGFSRKSEPKEYKFEKRKRGKEEIINGKKYNVKLIQEWKLPTGKGMQNYLNQKKKKQQKQPNDQQNGDNKSNTNTKTNGNGVFYICEGSVVTFKGEAIVNAANGGMIGGSGVDGAISDAGGDALYYLRKQVPCISGSEAVRCRAGDAKITLSGYPYNRLKCDYVIHAVGPNYSVMYRDDNKKMSDIDNLLYSSYARAMILCQQYNIKSVGFCLISSGVFRGSRSLDAVLSFGIQAVRDYMYPGVEVYMIGYTNMELCCLAKNGPKILGTPLNEHSKVKERKLERNRWSRNSDPDDADDGGGWANIFKKRLPAGKRRGKNIGKGGNR